MNPADEVVRRLDVVMAHPWLDQAWLASTIHELAQACPPHDERVLASWCQFVDAAQVWERVQSAPPERLLTAVLKARAAPVSEERAERLRTTLEALMFELLLSRPELVSTVPQNERPSWKKRLDDAGASLPPFTGWTSPWDVKRPKRAALKVDVPELPEVMHAQAVKVPDVAHRDEDFLSDWRSRPFRAAYLLLDVGDTSALKAWAELAPSSVYVDEETLSLLAVRFGVAGLQKSLEVVKANPSLLSALAPFESVRVAPVMAGALDAPRATLQQTARTWLTRFGEVATAALVPAALSGTKAAVEPTSALRFIKRSAFEAWTKGLSHFSDEVKARVDEVLSGGAVLPTRRPSLPEWLVPSSLPRPVSEDGGSALQAETLEAFVQLLKVTPLDGAPWVDEARAKFRAGSLAAMSRALLEVWLRVGAPPKERWMLQSCAHFGDDATAQFLASQAAMLAPKGLSSRAQEMAEVLGAMRSRASLSALHQLIRKVRSKAFRARAELIFTSTAEKMGFTDDELAERLVPDFGLRPDGRLPTDEPIFLEWSAGKVRFVDDEGSVLKSLPETGDDERDEELAGLKKRAASVLKEVVERLERRMSGQRRMKLDHFTETYAMHGLTSLVARRVLWGQWSGATMKRVFRLEGAAPVDEKGQPVPMSPELEVGVVHPLHLSAEVRDAWAKVMSDEALPQLQRKTQRFADVHALSKVLQRWVDTSVASGRLIGLEKREWVRGEQVGGGCYVDVKRATPSLSVRVEFEPGIYLGDPTQEPQQRITAVHVEQRGPPSEVEWSDLAEDLERALSGKSR
ncbi:MAG: DUF4132 domain-containing protein [Archangium sp.]|nr:DUF4132 domain-containing protein [Archangium sp.]